VGIPYVATVMGVKQVYPGRYAPDVLCSLIRKRRRSLSPIVCRPYSHDAEQPGEREVDLSIGR